MESLTPLSNRILVQRISEDKTYRGLIHLPDQAQIKAQVAIVIACGPGKIIDGQFQPCALKPGDKIMFGKYSGTDIKLNDVEYSIMCEEDVLGILSQK